MRRRWVAAAAVLGSLALALAGLHGSDAVAAPTAEPPATARGGELRLGWFPNLTHATAIVAVQKGTIKNALGGDVELETSTFNAGPAAIEALLSGAIDASYIGPNPAINAFVKSKGRAVRVIAGATSGGAFFVVDPSIQSAADLKGKKVASPQLGNTQDVALRAWLKEKGFTIDLTGKSDVQILPQENAQTLEAFRQKHLAGAWVPEPWASRLILEGGGKVLVDERDLWPDRQYVTTHLLVRADYLEKNPQIVKALLKGHVEAGAWLVAHPDDARTIVNDTIGQVTGKKIGDELLQKSWANLEFTNDPIAGSLKKSALDAQAAGLLDLGGLDVAKIYDLRLLNEVLTERGLAAVKS